MGGSETCVKNQRRVRDQGAGEVRKSVVSYVLPLFWSMLPNFSDMSHVWRDKPSRMTIFGGFRTNGMALLV